MPSRPPVTGAATGAGRHRSPRAAHLPGKTTLVGILAALTIMLASGVGLSLTTTSGDAADPSSGDPESALGAAPAVTTTPSSTPSPTPDRSPKPKPKREPEPEPEPEPDDGVDEITRLENRVTELTNAERAEAGCGELVIDDRLQESAGAHSQDMAVNDYFDHNSLDGRSPFDRMADAGYPDPAAENIAAGYRTPAEVMVGWMDSDGHRENILNCSLRAIGVGLAYAPDGRAYWTQNFGR